MGPLRSEGEAAFGMHQVAACRAFRAYHMQPRKKSVGGKQGLFCASGFWARFCRLFALCICGRALGHSLFHGRGRWHQIRDGLELEKNRGRDFAAASLAASPALISTTLQQLLFSHHCFWLLCCSGMSELGARSLDLRLGAAVRLRHSYVVACESFKRNDAGHAACLAHCSVWVIRWLHGCGAGFAC